MKNDSTHPARSADFLSRLHDGELTAAERAHFESHRAHCAECRAAAAEFEAALSMFRATTTSPPASDLPARILRKLGSTTRRRPPFGVVFGINLKWAAAFSTAILAVVIGSAVVFQRDAARKAGTGPAAIPVILPPQPQTEARPARAPSEASVRRDSPSAAKEKETARRKAPSAPASGFAVGGADAPADRSGYFSPAPEPVASAEQKAGAPAQRAPAAPARAEKPDRSAGVSETAPPRLLGKAESAGGEGAATSSLAMDASPVPARLVVVALDGQGSAPEIVSAGAGELLADLRGKQFLVNVDASGRVLDARTNDAGRLQKRARAADALESAAVLPPSVLGLRFRSSDRPRRLLLRIE